jgi:hypothetical protein
MGFFDFLKKKPDLVGSAEEPGTARSKRDPEPSAPGAPATPEGHQVMAFDALPHPTVLLTKGGVILASFGVAGDDPDRDLDTILRGVGGMLDKEPPPARLVNVNQRFCIDELFAPARPEILPFRTPVSWIFHHGAVASLAADPRRVQALLRAMHTTSTRKGGPIQQAAYFVDPPSPETRPFTRLLSGLGVLLKQPDDTEGSLRVMVEVERPDGILCVMAGKPYPADDPPDGYARSINEEKARALAAGHEGLRARLEAQELEGLADRLEPLAGRPVCVLRAPRLRQVILDSYGKEGNDGVEALLQVLLGRSAVLYTMRDAAKGIAVSDYGSAGRAVPVFADPTCVAWAAEDMGRAKGSYEVGAIPLPALAAMAAQGGVGVAICAYEDRKMPVYAILPALLVSGLTKVLAERGRRS